MWDTVGVQFSPPVTYQKWVGDCEDHVAARREEHQTQTPTSNLQQPIHRLYMHHIYDLHLHHTFQEKKMAMNLLYWPPFHRACHDQQRRRNLH